MSDPKLISPMLDNFNMGDPISERNGVRCCPAMERYSDNRYIVKIISVPSDPAKLDALMLSGAYSTKEEALSYYSMLANDIQSEAKLLEKLSQLDGFIPFDSCQVVEMDDGNGYDVYLLSSYGTTLQKRFRNGSLTHLEALNLGLDICAALSVSRRSGYLYADLKPSNIFITTERGYRIGDLGFLKLDALKYASLPERYHSQYTAPEISDAYSALNTTLDIYAVGLILYQIFNNGVLPFTGDTAPAEEFPAPAFADYEMSEIILKACAPDPEQRWQDPVDLGKALVEYMQRNGAHDTPITPVASNDCEENEQPVEIVSNEEENQTGIFEATEQESSSISDTEGTEVVEEESEPEITEESIFTEDEEGNLTFLADVSDETQPGADDAQIEYTEVSEELSDMLQQADELIAHEAPEPVVQPEAVEVPIPEPIHLTDESPTADDSEEADTAEESTSDADTSEECVADADNSGENPAPETAEETQDEHSSEESISEDEDSADESSDEDTPPEKAGKVGRWIRNALLILLALALLAFGFYYYKNYYLQPIDAILLEENSEGVLRVQVSASIDESKLTVVCSDTYGNKLLSPVENGRATFTGLSPNSAYTVKVMVDGFHRLIGDTSAAYTTPMQTNIVHFTAATGTEEGSIILSFGVEGPDADQWHVSYIADDGNHKEMTFAGHTVTLNGFTVGKSYTFSLMPLNGQSVTGETEVTYTASAIIKAVNLVITGCVDNTLTAAWSAPEGATVESWTVRCYNDNGFDNTTVTDETTASFQITDANADYTVEVTASGMSVSERIFASAGSMSIQNFKIAEATADALTLSWDSGELAQNGWKLAYIVDGSSSKEVSCSDNSAVVSPVVPGGEYTFTLQPADGTAVLGGELHHKVADAASFSAYGVTTESMEFRMCLTPSYSGWDRWSLSDSDYRTTFAPGENASFLIKRLVEYVHTDDTVTTLFVIRDENGNIISAETSSELWADMWIRGYCALDIPSIPQAPGNYTVSVFFNGALAQEVAFTISG